MVNQAGKRFINDQGGYGVGMKVVEQGGTCWAIFDQSMIDGVADVREYGELGMYESAATIEELAAKIGVRCQVILRSKHADACLLPIKHDFLCAKRTSGRKLSGLRLFCA